MIKSRGFTLIELIIVIAIIGILAAIGIPTYTGQQLRAARTEAYSNLQALRLLEEQYYAENGCYYSTGGTCTTSTTAMDTLAEIQAVLPGFKPGDDASLNYSYKVETSGTPAASAFTATATGKTGTRVDGDSFWIKQDNTKNF